MSPDRFDRHMPFFGKKGQERIAATRVAVVGVGGLGTHVVQQLALLGVRRLSVVDGEEVAESNRNRHVGLRHDDPIPGTTKVQVAERMARDIDPRIQVVGIVDSLVSDDAFAAVRAADHVFGCVDSEGARLVLTELCAAYRRPYTDLASDIFPGDQPAYGGRVCTSMDGQGCIVCYDSIEIAEAHAELSGPAGRRDYDAIYGVKHAMLDRSGPSVVSLNGVVASLAVTEFMVSVTKLRSPQRLLTYYGATGKVTATSDEPAPDCYYCKGVLGRGASADTERYIRAGVGSFLR